MFSSIFTEATKLGEDLHGEEFQLLMPGVNGRQVHHSNVETQSAEFYFLFTIYDVFVSHVIGELQSRFVDNPGYSLGLLQILPSECCSTCERSDHDAGIPEKLANAVAFYENTSFAIPSYFPQNTGQWGHQGPGQKKLVDAFSAQ